VKKIAEMSEKYEVCSKAGYFQGHSSDWNRLVIIKATCKSWDCPVCGKIKLARLRSGYQHAAVNFRLQTMITLTLPSDWKKTQIKSAWALFRRKIHHKFGRAFDFLATVELQKRGAPHLHVLVSFWIDKDELQRLWWDCGGGLTWINRVDIQHVVGYVTKHFTKQSMDFSSKIFGRRVMTSRSIKLNISDGENQKKYPGFVWNFCGGDFFQAVHDYLQLGYSPTGNVGWADDEVGVWEAELIPCPTTQPPRELDLFGRVI